MWVSVFKFEVLYRLKRVETYLYFVFLLAVSVFAFDFIYYEKELGELAAGSPQVIGTTMAVLSGFFMIISSMLMGVSVLKDFEVNIDEILFVNPIQKWEYLLGRYLGSSLILVLVFSAILLGMMLGDWMPWREAAMELDLAYLVKYLHTFAVVVLPTLFYGGSVFFVCGMLSRSMVVVYTQGLVFFLILLICLRIGNPTVASILDPFSHLAIRQMMSLLPASQSVLELLPVDGVFLYNRLFWGGIGFGALLLGYVRFSFGRVLSGQKGKGLSVEVLPENRAMTTQLLVPVSLSFSKRVSIRQLISNSEFYFLTILRKPVFWLIITCGIVAIVVNTIGLNQSYGVSSFPVTYLILDELKEMSIFFFFIILGLYTSDVIWRERASKIEQVVDALPVSDLVVVGGKFIGVIGTYLVLLVCLLLCGIIFQFSSGYSDFQFEAYFFGLLEVWLFLVLYTVASFFFQILSNSPYVGHVLLLVVLILTSVIKLLGLGHGLYNFGGPGLIDFSELNRYGASKIPFVLFKGYWISFCLALLAVTSALYPRGKEVDLRRRIQGWRVRMTSKHWSMVRLSLVCMLLIGSVIFYNTNVVNTFHSSIDKEEFRASYETSLKKFEYLPQPNIVDISLALDLFPNEEAYNLKGAYVLKNVDSFAID